MNNIFEKKAYPGITVPCHLQGPDAHTTPSLMEALQLAAQLPGVFFSLRKWAFCLSCLLVLVFFWLEGSPVSKAAVPCCMERARTCSFPSQNSAVLRLSKFTGMEGAPGQLTDFFYSYFAPKSAASHQALSLFLPFVSNLGCAHPQPAACKTPGPLIPPLQTPVATPIKAPHNKLIFLKGKVWL